MNEQEKMDTILDSAWTRLEMEGMHITSALLYEACNREYTLEECTEWMRRVDELLDDMPPPELGQLEAMIRGWPRIRRRFNV